jgi:hypothetical protein
MTFSDISVYGVLIWVHRSLMAATFTRTLFTFASGYACSKNRLEHDQQTQHALQLPLAVEPVEKAAPIDRLSNELEY